MKYCPAICHGFHLIPTYGAYICPGVASLPQSKRRPGIARGHPEDNMSLDYDTQTKGFPGPKTDPMAGLFIPSGL